MGGGPVSAYLISYIFRKINGIAVIKFGTFITTVAKDVYPTQPLLQLGVTAAFPTSLHLFSYHHNFDIQNNKISIETCPGNTFKITAKIINDVHILMNIFYFKF